MYHEFNIGNFTQTINELLIEQEYISEDNLLTGSSKLSHINIDSLDLMYLVLILTQTYKEIDLIKLEPIDLIIEPIEKIFNNIQGKINEDTN